MISEPPLGPGAAIQHPSSTLRALVRRTAWTTVGEGCSPSPLVRLVPPGRLTLNWIDNSGGAAKFSTRTQDGDNGYVRAGRHYGYRHHDLHGLRNHWEHDLLLSGPGLQGLRRIRLFQRSGRVLDLKDGAA